MIKFSSNKGRVICSNCGESVYVSSDAIDDEDFATRSNIDDSVTITHILHASVTCPKCDTEISIEGTFIECDNSVYVEDDWDSDEAEELSMPDVLHHSADDDFDDE